MSKDKWSALSAQERAQLINIYVQSGITDLDFIKKDYNSFDEGGSIEYTIPSPKDDIEVPYRSVITEDMRNNFITKSKNKFDTFVNRMYPIIERTLIEKELPTDNLHNVLKQMAHESDYGLNPRGNGYNLSGIKAWDDDEGTKFDDGNYYRDFKDYRDYADFYIDLLNNRYNALDAKDTNDYIYRLHHGKDGKSYSADEAGYKRNLTRMYSLDKAIKKYETNSAKGVRILDGTSEENQTLDNTPWYKKVLNALIEDARIGRDARIGAVGAEPLREMYASGQSEEADGGPTITDKEYTSIPEEVSEEDTQEYPKSFLESIQKAFERQPTKLLFDSYVDPVEVDQSLISKFSEEGTFKVPDDMPERKFVTYVNSKVKPIEDNTIQELQDLSTDELISLQRDLAADGAYDINLKEGKSKEAISIQKMLYRRKYLSKDDIDGNIGEHTIRALQQMLVDNHYLKENREDGKSNIDGWLGKRTREAFKRFNRDINIDGKLGDKTITAYQNKNAQKQGFNANVSAEGLEDNCAKWVTKKYDVVTGNRSKQNGVYGNAWTMMKNVEDLGGQMIFNIYDDPIFDNSKNVADSNSLKATTEKVLKSKKIDYNSLLPGDIVGIYVPSSSHHSDVLKEGTTYNTHVGIVADVQNGIPIIEHNINGNVRRENINKLTGSKYGKVTATVAVRPVQGEQVKGELEFENIKSEIKYPEKYKNELMDKYTDALASTKKALQDFYTTVDLDFIEKAAIAITKRETNYMTNKMSDQRKNIKNVKNFISSNLRAGIHNIKTPEEKISQDLNKMKFDSLPKNYRDAIGLYSPEQLSTDPTVTGRATMLLLSKNYEYLVRLAKENPDLNLTKEDIENAVIRSYNVGFKNIETLGFNPDGSININELYYLKNSGRPGVREKSINSTNYKYLGVLGNLIYNISDDDGYVPYVSAARKEMENLKKN